MKTREEENCLENTLTDYFLLRQYVIVCFVNHKFQNADNELLHRTKVTVEITNLEITNLNAKSKIELLHWTFKKPSQR